MADPEDNTSVRVATRIRPQNAREQIEMSKICTFVNPEDKQICLGKEKAFTYDYVYDRQSSQREIFEELGKPLIDGCLEGYNATLFAYGQTGSGKTFTMGTGFELGITAETLGIIPRAVQYLFESIEKRRAESLANKMSPPEFKVVSQFLELYNEELIDLLDIGVKGKKSSNIKIHEDAHGDIYLTGVSTRIVNSLEDTIKCLKDGALCRATASTNMNAQSSRSHAIFTLHIKQQRLVQEPTEPVEDGKEIDTQEPLTEFETLTAKFHFVDLAGSERLKRTGATGDRAREGISINCGLLALGNVISALGDKTKRGCHVPYRDSKLSRLLQDSLGGNSRTIMIACVSPSDIDFLETLNTLKYANRARNIQNKVVVNQDKTSKQLAALRAQLNALQQELMEYKQGKRVVSADGNEAYSDIYTENNMLQVETEKMRARVKALQQTIDFLKVRNAQLSTERELALRRVATPCGDENDDSVAEVTSLVEKYTGEIEELRAQLTESEAMLSVLQRSSSVSTSRLGASPRAIPMGGVGLDFPEDDATMMFSSMDSNQLLDLAREDLQSQMSQIGSSKKSGRRRKERPKKRPKLKEDSPVKMENGEAIGEAGVGSDEKENVANGDADVEMASEGDGGEEGDVDQDSMEEMDEEESNEEGSDGDDENDDAFSEGDDDEETEKDEEEEHGDLYESLSTLSTEITVKQRLIQELESKSKQLLAIRDHYETKLTSLMDKIRETEKERDKVLHNMAHPKTPTTPGGRPTSLSRQGSVESQSENEVKKIRHDYEKRLTSMQSELRKLQQAKKEHSVMLSKQKNREVEVRKLTAELTDLKRMKVTLMQKVTAETKRSREKEVQSSREIAQLRKERRQQDNQLKKFEQERKQKENVLRRKQQEVEALRKRQARPLSEAASGRVSRAGSANASTSSISSLNSTAAGRVNKSLSSVPPRVYQPRATFAPVTGVAANRRLNPRLAKTKWDTLEKTLNKTVGQRQTLGHVERDMENWMSEREKVAKKLEQLQNKTETSNELEYQKKCVQEQLETAEENIRDCQNQVLELEEAREEDVAPVFTRCTLEESRYLLEHLYDAGLTRGLEAAQQKTEVRELQSQLEARSAELEQARQMLGIALQLHSDIPLEFGSDTAGETEEDDGSDSQTTRLFSEVSSDLSAEDQRRKHKIRRKTNTPEELLLGGAHPVTSSITPMQTVQEAANRMTQSMDEGSLMPPPKTVTLPRQRPQRLPLTSESTLPHSATDPSPLMRRKAMLGSSSSSSALLNLPRPAAGNLMTSSLYIPRNTNSDDTAGTITTSLTPPGSPPSFRRNNSLRGSGREGNVFNRLTGGSKNGSPNPGKGVIYSSKMSTSSSTVSGGAGAAAGSATGKSPGAAATLECTHMAEGHTKPILDLDVAGSQMITGSKDRTAKLWDINKMEEVMTLGDHHNNVSKVRFWPEASLVFTVCAYYIKLWDVRSGECVRTLLSSGLAQEGPPEISVTMRQNICPPGETNINDLALARPQGGTGASMYLATANSVKLWDLRRFGAVGKLHGNHQAPVMALACEVDGDGDCRVITGSKDHYIKVFRVPNASVGLLTPICDLQPPHYDGIEALALSGGLLFSGSRDNGIKKWNLGPSDANNIPAGAVTQAGCVNNAHKDWIQGLVLYNNLLFSCCRAGVVKAWRADDCSLVSELNAHQGAVNAMRVSTEQQRLFTVSNDCNVKFWKLLEDEVMV